MRKVFPLLAIVMGVVWIVYALDYGLWVRRGPGGGFFPLIGGGITVLFSLPFLKNEIFRPTAVTMNVRFLYPILAILAALAVSYALGMVPSLFLFIFFWLWRFEKRTALLSLGVSAATMLSLYLVFVYWLSVPLPRGWLLG